MRRRSFAMGAAALALAACATQAPPTIAPDAQAGFASDRISVVTRGAGPDVILIPGMASHRDVWTAAAAPLEGRYRLHLVQVNGFAGVPAGANADGQVSAPVAEEIARYVAESGLDHPAVIGHSMGGTIAMMLAARHPEAVGRLMVVDMFPFMGAMFGGQTPDAVRPVADAMRAQMLNAPPGAAGSMVEQMITNMTLTESVRPELIRQARTSNTRTVANSFHELIVTDLRPELGAITAPLTVLYVIPPEAPLSPAQYEQYFHLSFANAPQARLIKIEESRHFIQIDQTERFVREVDAFMDAG